MTKGRDYREAALRAVGEHIGFRSEAVRLAALRFYVSETTIWAWLSQQAATGDVGPKRKRGRKDDEAYVVAPAHVQAIKDHIDYVDAEIYEEEMCEKLFEEFGIWYTQQQISAVLIQSGYTSKKISRIAAEQQADERQQWTQDISSIPAHCLVFVDESHLNAKAARRSRGRALKGRQAFRRQPGVRGLGECSSSICAMDICGVFIAKAYSEIVEGVTFLDWFEHELLPLCAPYPRPRSAVILDNASVHMKAVLLALIDLHQPGVLLFFLPPYSYDFNPIENCFHLGKARFAVTQVRC